MSKQYMRSELEYQIDPRGYNKWMWLVAIKNGGDILEMGEVSGGRYKAEKAANAALDRWVGKKK